LGISHFDPRITIISNPSQPDNFRMMIKTENPPSDIKPPMDSKVPDLISGGPSPTPKVAKSPSPAPAKADNSPEKPNATSPSKPFDINDLAQPLKSASPLQAPPPPVELLSEPLDLPAHHLVEVPPPPPLKNTAPPVAEAAPAPPKPTPQETPHPAAEASPSRPTNDNHATAAASDKQEPAGEPKIVALSVDPAPLKDAIPSGVREGAFSISPAGTVQGAAGGAPGAPTDVGNGGQGQESENSVGVGNGSPGGGHGTSNLSASPGISVSGRAGATGISAGTLAPLKAEDLVYAVNPETPKTRAPGIVVSSGSWGGGGLQIYGVLHGDKIYTVYFSMPGKSWILQYCARENPPPADAAARVVQIHIQPPLTPPAAIEQFDFHRPTAPQDPGAMIILHGIIHEDGSVSDLAVLQGFDPTSNAAACSAFSRWKFKPAQRAGIPVALEILVGIP
jgi:hypothetical protein